MITSQARRYRWERDKYEDFIVLGCSECATFVQFYAASPTLAPDWAAFKEKHDLLHQRPDVGPTEPQPGSV